MNYVLLYMPGPVEIIVVVLVILLLFGGRKIPELMRGLGRGMKEFKNAQRDDQADEKKEDEKNNKQD